MNRLACLLTVSLAVASCSIGAPPGFSGGDSWTIPLVGPLEDGVLITPVFINDKGPYLMGFDPDSPTSEIDEAMVSELQLHNGIGPKMLDESDTNRNSRLAEVRLFRLGALTVRNRTVAVMKVGSFGSGGRQLRGMIGRDVIADSLAFGFDRERGVAYLATQKGFTAPAAAETMGYDLVSNRLNVEVQPVGRRISKVQIGGKSFKMHLDLGIVSSQLRENLWAKAGMTSIPVASDLRDEVGTIRHTDVAAVAAQVIVGAYSASGVLFAPYQDKRWEDEDIDGTLGLNFFRTLNVWANWDQSKFYLVPRGDVIATTKERISRWNSPVLDACEHQGCVALGMIDPAASGAAVPAPAPLPPGPSESGAPGAGGPPGASGAPAVLPRTPRPVLTLTRDASAASLDLEILLAAVGADGQPSELPRLVVNLPAGTNELSNQLDPSYSGSKIVVLDVSPYPRSCPRGDGGCIASLATSH